MGPSFFLAPSSNWRCWDFGSLWALAAGVLLAVTCQVLLLALDAAVEDLPRLGTLPEEINSTLPLLFLWGGWLGGVGGLVAGG